MKCEHLNWAGIPEVDAYCVACGKDEMDVHTEHMEPGVILKGGTFLSVGEAAAALEEAMTIIEAVGTTGIYSRTQAAQAWMKRYFPNWA